MLIHIIRHTTPDVDPGTCYGQTDLCLAETFEQESELVLGKLLDCYDAVYTSPLKRCFELAMKVTSTSITTDTRLLEYNFGDWEMLPWSSFSSETAKRWMDNFVDQTAPNGESLVTMQARVNEFWRELTSMNYQSVALVTHAGVQRLIHAAILETPLSHIFRLQLDYGAVLEVNSDKETSLLSVKHL